MSNLNIAKEDATDEEIALALHSLIEQQEVSPIHDLEGLSDLWPVWIAATAVRFRIPLLSHDRDHAGLKYPDLHVVSYVQ